MSHIGIDLGTSSVKAVLMADDGSVTGQASAPLSVSRPHPGWSEQDPADWWSAACDALDALAKSHPEAMRGVRGIGLSGQQHGATLIDADGRPIRPCLLWNDGRAHAECAALEKRADFRRLTGNVAMAGFTAPKVEWVRTHEPEAFERIAKVLLPKDYLRLELTGETMSDMSDSAGTLWLDVAGRSWSLPLLAASGLQAAQMPHLVEGSEPAGRIRPALAERWGFAEPPVVAGGGGDNAAAACGVGAVGAGQGFVSIGTSGVMFVVTDGFLPNAGRAVHAFCHAVPGLWHQMGVILSAADSLTWLSRISGKDAKELGALAARSAPDDAPLFLPYLSGERTPHNDPTLRGAFVGLSHADDVGALARSVMEGVAFAFADSADALREAGTAFGDLLAVGGGARSDLWLQMISDAARIELSRPAGAEAGAALGAARLGRCAAEGLPPSEVCPAPAVEHRVAPDGGAAERVADRLGRWREALAAARMR